MEYERQLRHSAKAAQPSCPFFGIKSNLATLTAYRFLMTWLYGRTDSLLLAMLMHASYTG